METTISGYNGLPRIPPVTPPRKKPDRAATEAYTAEDIKVLEGMEAIRKRPGMYVGGTGLSALHQLVYECVDNSIDEVMAGWATSVVVRLGVDGSCTVIDNGRGMPLEPMQHENPAIAGRPAVEVIMTEVHAGGKFDHSVYKTAGGLHGVGVKCVNALSEWTEVEVVKDGQVHLITFERGTMVEPLHVLAERADATDEHPDRTGTRISFLPDAEIFNDIVFRYEMLQHRLRELAYLNSGVTIRLIDERVDAEGKPRRDEFHFEDGIVGYVEHLNRSKTPFGPVVSIFRTDEDSGLACEVALQYTDATNETLLAFGNNILTPDGGTHVAGFKTSLTRTINGYAKRRNLLKGLTPSGEDLREGLTAVISVKLPEPQFNNQTKEKLLNPEVEKYVAGAISRDLKAWLEEHPSEAREICMKAILAAQAREAARKARDLIKRKGALESGGMPQKLADCVTKDMERSEIFIVEGDSAGGSAKSGRDHETQAVLPLKGKILNVEKARLDKILNFEEIQILIKALQCGIGEDFDIAKLRYGRVIIMTDADVDGSHIRTLLLTFFFRQMPELIRHRRIYIAQPPLYQITRNKQSRYVRDEVAMDAYLVDEALRTSVLVVRDDEGHETNRMEGEELGHLVRLLRRLDELVEVSHRRGLSVEDLLASRDRDPSGTGRMPTFLLEWIDGQVLCWAEDEAKHVITSSRLILDDLSGGNGNVPPGDRRRVATLRHLHENAEIDSLATKLAAQGIDIADWNLVQEESVSGEKMPTRFAWISDPGGDSEAEFVVPGVPGILPTLKQIGRRGIEVKRFKGLGEMNPEELWDTTMNASQRTLLCVTWDTASEADQLFTTLMGENVEIRRAYIEEHALEVESIDI